MVTKGIILSKNVIGNKYKVRIPYLENAGQRGSSFDAIVAIVPGIVNSFAVGDRVILSFEDHQPQQPVIIGKLFVDVDEKDARGFANFEELSVRGQTTLSENTYINDIKLYNKIRELENRLKTLEDMFTPSANQDEE